MTAPQQQGQALLDLEHEHGTRRRPRGPVTFSDDASLMRRLERRATDRRHRERREPVHRGTTADLGLRDLCHDLRQPLASAFVLAHMAAKDGGLSDAGRQRLEELQTELARLGSMLTAHLEPAAPRLVDVASVVRAVCTSGGGAGLAEVELVQSDVPLVLGDEVQLTRLVANLVANARNAAGAAGRVRVQVGASAGAARIAVEDSGGAAGAPSASGFGLGLMIVDAVVRRHGGTSACTASALGGLEVAVSLPAGLPPQDVGGRP